MMKSTKTFPVGVMIDSGAYSAFMKKEEIVLDEYITYIHRLVRKCPDILYVNLDVIGDGAGSYRNWQAMRKAGLAPLPVYHVTTDVKWLKRYLRHTDYIGLGAIVNMSSPKRTLALDRIWSTYLVHPNRLPSVRVHGMGITSFPLMRRYPWYSLDSTSWLQAGIFGKIFVPRQRNGQWDYNRKPYSIGISNQSPSQKERGKHAENLTQQQKKLVLQYVNDAGFSYGESRWEDGEEHVIEPGVSNDYNLRCQLNIFFYAQFSRGLVWPRPFTITASKGLLQ